ncbi:hypothetical protein BCR42DRAFT_491473 [Absidia repens]|uniref:BHLH domain-containing protein n=1 Tax=Absidia repens TaxID=90262 RepID=A0A1X2IHC6_9FUNG|nr:hypothetical protein BCR42DRAFT_491473 [Absidia repens]
MNTGQNVEEDGYNSAKSISQLKHPTAYHLQQQRLKYKDIDFNHSQLFISQNNQHQQPNEGSPHLSDIDYTDMTSPIPLHTDYSPYSSTPDGPALITPLQNSQHYHHPQHRHHQRSSLDQDYLYDDQSIDSSLAFSSAEQMRRVDSNDYGSAKISQPISTASPQQEYMFYPSQNTLDHRFKQFAVSAPVNINYSNTDPLPAPHPSSSFNDGDFLPGGGIAMVTSSSAGNDNNNNNFGYPGNPRSESRSLENYEDDYAAQVNLQAIMEKRRRRRESHNAVERRRRDNINDRIQELGTLLVDTPDDGINRLNKGTILKKSVEQIKLLQQDLTFYRQRVQELESILKQVKVASQ